MKKPNRPVRVLYSFPHKLGADRICYTAWNQVDGISSMGADVIAMPGVLHRAVPPNVRVLPTMAMGKLRVSYKLLGTLRACALHDYVVARRLAKWVGKIDIIHVWPLGALRTLKEARRLGIPTVLERPNAHTRFAYEVVQEECQRIGVPLPPDHEHAYKADWLKIEEEEYSLATRLLCPSEFTAKTFQDKGFSRDQIARHIYGYDEKKFFPLSHATEAKRGLTMISVGVCAVRKGLHFALEAWIKSPASKDGIFLIAGEFLPAYADKLKDYIKHPSVKVLGHRTDVPELLRKSDILVLPSIEEGFGLVCTEAMGSGCVPLVSDACTDLCRHMENSLVHRVGDVTSLYEHITMLHNDRDLLARMREQGLRDAPGITWRAAGGQLVDVYWNTILDS